MRITLAVVAVCSVLTIPQALAQEGPEVLNRTSHPIAQLYFTPVGRDLWGTNQIPSGQVLKVDAKAPFTVDYRSGRYSAKLVHSTGRVCRIKSIVVGRNELVTLDDSDLSDCSEAVLSNGETKQAR